MYDAIVIGGGPAGASAATLLGRALRHVLVIDAGATRNAPANHLHGYLGLDGLAPTELNTRGRDEAQRYGCEWVQGKVASVQERNGCGFTVRDSGGRGHHARSVIVATGLRDVLPSIPGIDELWGNRVIHCPYCHGYEVRNSRLGVVGGENRAFTLHQAALVRLWSDDVAIFPNTIELSEDERRRLTSWGVRIVDGRVRQVREDQSELTIELANGEHVSRSTVFVGPTFVPNDALLGDLGCVRTDDGWIAADETGATSVAGVWAAGNVADSPAQIIHAAAQGARAGIAVNHYLLDQDIRSLDHTSGH
ncbi:NAD(P)/FAD-dependent oxidoreductase [Rhodococcus sp. W8901]|uniref:NAD(P)/FAD-dependent oxidoreductase n=1 Tax=Rhodococcus sp. W8901 TaxID=2742603 RepID=UPI001582C173|nr:NAD(P)/FAD-dependent oxidoreductase [Rhodococcus sp. W8901]QKT13729.1 NAD(P)/FAD-dependent oxidoreductase [Rhodococcus sp. W8901]